MSVELHRIYRQQYGTCLRKIRYPNRQRACAAGKAIKRREGESHGHPYPCDFCEGWHLGHRA